MAPRHKSVDQASAPLPPPRASTSVLVPAAPRLAFPAFQGLIEARSPLSVQVSRRLRAAIIGGGVEAGTELPSEKDLGRDLGVGRSTVREAVRILKAQGLVSGGDSVSTKRPRVADDRELSAAAAQAMENVVLLGKVPLRDLVELRVVLEGAAVEAAALRELDPEAEATSDPDPIAKALTRAEEALTEMASPDLDVVRFRAADVAFHLALAAAAGNATYPLIMGVLRSAISAHLGEALALVPDFQATTAALLGEHRAIFEAVAKRRPKRARELVSAHVRDFYASSEPGSDRREQGASAPRQAPTRASRPR
jgi:GntR family transcriptional regulator, transcriptional repressor for pyruvate dehydrogenase complex